jgi:hypothetical protein
MLIAATRVSNWPLASNAAEVVPVSVSSPPPRSGPRRKFDTITPVVVTDYDSADRARSFLQLGLNV